MECKMDGRRWFDRKQCRPFNRLSFWFRSCDGYSLMISNSVRLIPDAVKITFNSM